MEGVVVASVRSGLLHLAKGERLTCNGSSVDDENFKVVDRPAPDAKRCAACFKSLGSPGNLLSDSSSESTSPVPQAAASSWLQAARSQSFVNDSGVLPWSSERADIRWMKDMPEYQHLWETTNWKSIVEFLNKEAVRSIPHVFDELASVAERTGALNEFQIGKVCVTGFMCSAPPGLRGLPFSGVLERPKQEPSKKRKSSTSPATPWGDLPEQVKNDLEKMPMHLAGKSLAHHSALVRAITQADLGLNIFCLEAGALSSLRQGLEHPFGLPGPRLKRSRGHALHLCKALP